MIKIKEKTIKKLKISWTIILFLIFLFFLIKYIITKDPTQIIGIAIFLILTITMIIDLYLQIKKLKNIWEDFIGWIGKLIGHLLEALAIS